jgi:hypothetical protein
MSERLKARVDARNRANYVANVWHPKLAEAFAPFVGKKIKLQEGGLTKAASAAVAALDLPNGAALRLRVRAEHYWLSCEVSAWESLPTADSTGYRDGFTEKETINIGNIASCVLTKLAEPKTDRRTDFTVDEIVEKHRKADELRRLAREAESNLYPFGDCDR